MLKQRTEIKPTTPSIIVQDQYTREGWSIYKTNNCINNFIAFRNRTLHFIQVITPKTNIDNFVQSTFVQNAMSNAAIPIYALVDENSNTIFTNVNTNTPVSIKKIVKKIKQQPEIK